MWRDSTIKQPPGIDARQEEAHSRPGMFAIFVGFTLLDPMSASSNELDKSLKPALISILAFHEEADGECLPDYKKLVILSAAKGLD